MNPFPVMRVSSNERRLSFVILAIMEHPLSVMAHIAKETVLEDSGSLRHVLVVPRVSSERRKYMPLGFKSSETIASDALLFVPDIIPFHFDILTSSL